MPLTGRLLNTKMRNLTQVKGVFQEKLQNAASLKGVEIEGRIQPAKD